MTLHARTALEEVCARGDLERAQDLYAPDFVNHVNALLRIEVVDQVGEGARRYRGGCCKERTAAGA
jgi:hypothetical protein